MNCGVFVPVIGSMALCCFGQQPIGVPTISPGAITAGVQTSVTVSILIAPAAQTVLSNSVNLLQVDSSGKVISTLGSLNDNGTNGDLVLGDDIYSGTFTIRSLNPGSVYFQASAALKGVLKRSLSGIASLSIAQPGTPIAPLLPDGSQFVTDSSGNAMTCNEILVRFASSATPNDIANTLASINGTIVGQFPEISFYQISIPACSADSLNSAIQTLRSITIVLSAAPNTLLTKHAGSYVPNDPFVGLQWNVSSVHLPQAWESDRRGATIGIIDDGVSQTHEDLVGRVARGINWCSRAVGATCVPGADPATFAGGYHGTAVAGIAAATADNAIGIAGAAFRASIISEGTVPLNCVLIICLASNTYSSDLTVNAIIDAVDNGARVLNISSGCHADVVTCPDANSPLGSAVQYALAHGVVVVASAGNEDTSTRNYPASYPGVISVAASDESDQRANWLTCSGAQASEPASNFGPWVDLYAPGKDIILLRTDPVTGPSAYIDYCQAGTSSAAPLVTGTISLMLAANPHLTPSQVKAILKNTSENTGNSDNTSASSNTIYLLDSYAAVQQAISQVAVNDVPPTAGFLMSSGNQSVKNGQTLNVTVSPGGSAVVSFDGSSPTYSSDIDGTVVSWLWSVGGRQVSTASVFSQTLAKGTYQISLVVGDDGGTFGFPPAVGTIVVAESAVGFSPTGSMNEPRADFAATLLNNGTVLVTGGLSNGTVNAQSILTAEIYTPGTGTWSYTASRMTTGRAEHTSTKLLDGRVLIVGGFSGFNGMQANAEIFDPVTGGFTATPPMTAAHTLQGAVLLQDGRVLIVAGATTMCEIYDPVANTWSPAAPLPYAATRLRTALLPDGTVLASGGYDFPNPGLATAFVNLYNPATNTWRPMTSLLQPRLDHTMTVLPNGQVLIVAGTDSYQTTNSVEIYTPTAGTNGQTQFGSYLIDDRRAHTATPLPNGDVLVAGGYQGILGFVNTGYLASTQIFQHSTQTWSPVQLMITAHSEHIATLLETGQVVIAGGIDPAYLKAAELWTP